jgi:hypothetical protein
MYSYKNTFSVPLIASATLLHIFLHFIYLAAFISTNAIMGLEPSNAGLSMVFSKPSNNLHHH